MSSRLRRVRRLAVLGAVLVVLPSCALHGLSFAQDDRVSITAPDDRSKVELPVTLQWTDRRQRAEGSFAVFVDQAPSPPGRTLDWVARGDQVCAGTKGCPDAAYLRDHDVYRTTKTALTLTRVPELNRSDRRQFHEATIVLLDDKGARMGKSAFRVEFRVEKDR